MVFLDMCSKALLPFSCTAEEIIDFGIRRIFRALRANRDQNMFFFYNKLEAN